MGLLTGLKAAKALRLQKNGNTQEAKKLYEEAFAEGLNDPRYILPYALMIIRAGEYQKAKEFLVKHQKAPLSPSQRTELLVYYAVCCLRLGDVDKGIQTLEQQFRKGETGLLYQTLGYLYVVKYDRENTPDFAALAAEAAAAAAAAEAESAEKAENAEGEEESAGAEAAEDKAESEEPKADPEETWNAGIEQAEAFIRKSLEYDEEDPICLDNMGQFVYRVRGDRAGAKEWFEKALSIKNNQIDTLYFLSRYDLEAGDSKAALEKLKTALEGRFSPLNYCDKETIQQEIEKLKGAQGE